MSQRPCWTKTTPRSCRAASRSSPRRATTRCVPSIGRVFGVPCLRRSPCGDHLHSASQAPAARRRRARERPHCGGVQPAIDASHPAAQGRRCARAYAEAGESRDRRALRRRVRARDRATRPYRRRRRARLFECRDGRPGRYRLHAERCVRADAGAQGRHAAVARRDDALASTRSGRRSTARFPRRSRHARPTACRTSRTCRRCTTSTRQHVALSYQFFNKTRQNVLATRRAVVLVIDPDSFARFRIALEYVRVETSGPLFERMKAHLAGIASHTGMAGVFKLQGADVYRVLVGRAGAGPFAAGHRAAAAPSGRGARHRAADRGLRGSFEPARRSARRARRCARHPPRDDPDGGRARAEALHGREPRLRRVGRRLGDRVRRRRDRRRGARDDADPHHASRLRMGLRPRDPRQRGGGRHGRTCSRRRFPCRDCPIRAASSRCRSSSAAALSAVLYVEDVLDRRFGFDDEDALVAVAALLGPTIRGMQELAESAPEPAPPRGGAPPVQGPPVDRSPLRGRRQRVPRRRLPHQGRGGRDLLEAAARLHGERPHRVHATASCGSTRRSGCPTCRTISRRGSSCLRGGLPSARRYLAIEKTGRGRFRFCVRQPVELVEMAGAGGR